MGRRRARHRRGRRRWGLGRWWAWRRWAGRRLRRRRRARWGPVWRQLGNGRIRWTSERGVRRVSRRRSARRRRRRRWRRRRRDSWRRASWTWRSRRVTRWRWWSGHHGLADCSDVVECSDLGVLAAAQVPFSLWKCVGTMQVRVEEARKLRRNWAHRALWVGGLFPVALVVP